MRFVCLCCCHVPSNGWLGVCACLACQEPAPARPLALLAPLYFVSTPLRLCPPSPRFWVQLVPDVKKPDKMVTEKTFAAVFGKPVRRLCCAVVAACAPLVLCCLCRMRAAVITVQCRLGNGLTASAICLALPCGSLWHEAQGTLRFVPPGCETQLGCCLPAVVYCQPLNAAAFCSPSASIHEQVSLKFVPDYHQWVPKQDVLLLKDMSTKAKTGRYLSIDQFRWDAPVLAFARVGKDHVLHWAIMRARQG